MKRLINVIKKIVISFSVWCVSLYTKAFALGTIVDTQILYGVPPRKQKILMWQNICKILSVIVIPIAFIIGGIVYFKKSKSSTKRKVITLLVALIIVCLVCFIANYILANI